MVQVKKESIRTAIVDAARAAFCEGSYHGTSMAKIARNAGVSSASIYTYFPSKLDLIFEVYGDFLTQRISEMEERLEACTNPRDCIRSVLIAFWGECTSANGMLAHNFVQALALVEKRGRYSDRLLPRILKRIQHMLAVSLNGSSLTGKQQEHLSYLIVMAYDGFAINTMLNEQPERIAEVADTLSTILTAIP